MKPLTLKRRVGFMYLLSVTPIAIQRTTEGLSWPTRNLTASLTVKLSSIKDYV
jgi:hypothetical protein